MNSILGKLIKNKVFLYMISRYATYALQFVSTLLIAIKLGPTDFGIWSFVLLVINFFNIIDFGISNSINVILVHDKDNEELCATHIKTVFIINLLISFIVLLLFIGVEYLDVPLLDKYHASNYYFYILLIVVFYYFNKSFASIYRVKNRLLEVALFQSTTPVLVFLSVVLISNKALINYLVGSYLIGYFVVLLVFIAGGQIKLSGHVSVFDIKNITGKGFWLFMYNSAFYLIIYFTSIFVSAYYTVGEFGKFNLSITLSNAIILLIDSFGFIIFPKMIDRLSGNDFISIQKLLDSIRLNYTNLVCFLIYAALPVFYYFCLLIRKYEDAGLSLCLAALSLVPYTFAFGINTFLIAQNKEKRLSIISLICLVFNSVLVYSLIRYLHISYAFTFLSVLVSYSIYTLLCAFLQFRQMKKTESFVKIIFYAFPVKQLIPFVLSIIVVNVAFSWRMPILLLIPLIVYLSMNLMEFKNVLDSIKVIVNKPNIVDL